MADTVEYRDICHHFFHSVANRNAVKASLGFYSEEKMHVLQRDRWRGYQRLIGMM